jgi:hypothetical protein
MLAAPSRQHRDTRHDDKNAPDTKRFLPCADILPARADRPSAGVRRSLLRLKRNWGGILTTETSLGNAISAVKTSRVPRGHIFVIELIQRPPELRAMAGL